MFNRSGYDKLPQRQRHIHLSVRVFKPKREGARRNAKIIVAVRDACKIESEGFWSKGISCRPSLSNKQWQDKIARCDEAGSADDDRDRRLNELGFFFVLLCVLIILIQMSNDLSILSVNVRDIMSSSLCLSSMIDRVKCDIAIISEHKRKPNNASYLDSIHPDYKTYTQIESTDTSKHCSHFLGKGGIAIMYKKELELSICKITDFDFSRIIWLDIKRSHDRSWRSDRIWYLSSI